MANERIIVQHLQIHGRVQGVGYRISAKREAERLGLQGWVRNRQDGSVELRVTGPHPEVSSFMKWLAHGPPNAHVTYVETLDTADSPALNPADSIFEIRTTA